MRWARARARACPGSGAGESGDGVTLMGRRRVCGGLRERAQTSELCIDHYPLYVHI